MTTIAGPIRSGKTTELIKLCAEENAKGVLTYLVVATHDRVRFVVDLAKEMEISIPFPLTFGELELNQMLRGSGVQQILVDDADDLVRIVVLRMTGRHVGAMTFTVDAQQGDVTLLRAEPDQESGKYPLPGFVGTTDRAADMQYVAQTQDERDLQVLKDALLRRALQALVLARGANIRVEGALRLAKIEGSTGRQEVFADLSEAFMNDALRQQENARLQGDAVLQSARSAFSLHGIDLGTWVREDLPVKISFEAGSGGEQ